MSPDNLFFPALQRRKQYRLTRTGEYYADYGEYKQEIREDCLGRCVYCDCHENELGGPESMNLDHFRPRKHFEHLANNPYNLVWACTGCNRFKLDHWPALESNDTVSGEEGFIDPFTEERIDYFEIHQDGELIPLKPPAAYVISLLMLNRPIPKRQRRSRYQSYELLSKLTVVIAKLEQVTNLSDEQKSSLELMRASRAMFQERLDFSLR